MKKNLQTAMAKNFQKMVNEQPAEDTPSKKTTTTSEKKEQKKSVTPDPEPVSKVAPVMNEPVDTIPEPVQQVQPVQAQTPEPVQQIQPVQAQTPEPVQQIQPVQTQTPVNVQPQPVTQPIAQSIPQPIVQQVVEPIVPVQPQPIPVQQQVPVYAQVPVNPTVVEVPTQAPTITPVMPEVSSITSTIDTLPAPKLSKKSIPLMPEEKSSGVLHIRLGELRSYVDFMTQSGKISYQQYISNLIQQDYEKNKDLYLKYKSFMEQLNM